MSVQHLSLDLPEAFAPLFEPARFKVYYGGRGGAKSWAFAVALLIMGLQRPIRVLCARELQTSIKDSVHKLLSDLIAAQPVLAAHYEVQQTVIKGSNGTEFAFKGLKHNASEIKSYEGVDYVWVEEAQAVSENSWETLIPTIRKPGSEILICFNPKNPTDPTWKKFVARQRPGSIVRKVGWRDNPFFPDVLEQERIYCLQNEPESYAHIWEGEFDTRFSGAVYAKWIQSAIDEGRKCKVDPSLPVHTAWDLGYDDSTAIVWWQRVGQECRIVDAYENNGQDIEHYCDILKGRGYRPGENYVPHDAANKLLAAGGRSIVQQMHALGVTSRIVAATSQQNQIEALRKILRVTWWDEEKCADLIQAAMAYHFEYDEDRKAFKSSPCHDWSSHFCFVGETEVLTRNGTCQIKDLPYQGEVLTSCGWKQYINPRVTRKNAPLVEVVFESGYTVKCTPDHMFLTENGWKSAESLLKHSEILSTLTRSRSILMAAYTVCGLMKSIFHAVVEKYIGMCGFLHLVKYQRNVTYIIKTKTLLITTLKTLSALMQKSIYHFHLKWVGQKGLVFQVTQETLLLIGIGQKREDYGIKGTTKDKNLGVFGKEVKKIALIARKSFGLLLGRIKKALKENIARLNARPLIIENVRQVLYVSDVWCLTVPGVENFSLSNGAVVHNCDALEIIGQVWQKEQTSGNMLPQRGIGQITANELFWGDSVSKDPYPRNL